MGSSNSGIGRGQFPTTSWSAILQLKDPHSPQYRQTLDRLVQLYWKPVYCVIKYSFGKGPDDAKDLTQEFFLTTIIDGGLVDSYVADRGSFRAFVKGAIGNFINQAARDAGRKKRGGGVIFANIDADGFDPSTLVPDGASKRPDDLFDAAWNALVIERALAIVERRLNEQGRATDFQILGRHDLAPDGERASYAEIGVALGLSEAQVKHALIRARGALRDVLTEIVRDYVDGPDELARELGQLFSG